MVVCTSLSHFRGRYRGQSLSLTFYLFLLLSILGCKAAPTVTNLSPTSGTVGTTLIITGTGFGVASNAVTAVTVNSISAFSTLTWTSNTQISVLIPAGSGAGTVKVTASGTGTSGQTFTFLPSISSISPTSATVGSTLTIIGNGYSAATTVKVNAVTCTGPVVTGTTQVTCTLPAGSGSGQSVTVTSGGNSASTSTFTFLPSITSISPTSAIAGATLTINGGGYAAGAAATVGGVACTTTTWISNAQVTCVLPAGAGSSQAVMVTTGGNSATTSTFTFLPSITSIVPNPGASGATLTINGGGYTADATATVGGSACTSPNVVSNAQITCVNPSGTGSVTVVVADLAGSTSGFAFGYLPTISSTSPASGVVGSTLTINGGSLTTLTSVTVGGTACSIATTTVSQITCTITASSGISLAIVVTTNGGSATAGSTFTILPSITSISPTSAIVGATLTINGNGYSAATTVTVNAVTCTAPVVTGTTKVTCTLPSTSGASLSVIVTSGSSVTASQTFTMLPSISSLTTTSGIVGSTLQVNGNGFWTDSTVMLGTFSCIVSPAATTIKATCPVPAGSGINLAVVLTTNGNSVTAGSTFSILPSITSISPTSAIVGATLSINGGGYFSDSSVTIGAFSCTVTVVSNALVTCPVPAGSGTALAVKLTTNSNSVTAASTFSILPSITSISPTSAIVGATLTINGNGYSAATTVKVNGVTCTAPSVTGTSQVTCVLPAGAGSGLPVIVTTGGNSATNSTFIFLPSMTSLGANAAVGGTLTVNGGGFFSDSTVTLAGTSCTPVTVVSSSQVTCPVPVGSVGVGLTVTLTTGGNTVGSSSIPATFSVLPSITSITPNPAVIGATLTINGGGFDSSATATIAATACTTPNVVSSAQMTCVIPSGSGGSATVKVTSDGNSAQVSTFGFLPTISSLSPTSATVTTQIIVNGGSFTNPSTITVGGIACSATAYVNIGQYKCTIPVGGGVGQTLTLTTAGGSASISTFTFIPSITSISPTTQAIGATLTINGGGYVSTATVTVGGASCSPVTFISNAQITCPVPSGSGFLQPVIVTASGSSSNSLNFAYGPTLSGVTPAALFVGNTLTINGANFVSGSTSASVGGSPCTPVTFVSATQITCHVPTGTGLGVAVMVTVNAITTTISNAFWYGPTLTSISPTTQAIGATLTLNGANYVNGTSAVTVGGTSCISVTYVSVNQLTCLVPFGVGFSQQVLVTGSGGLFATVSAFQYGPTLTSISPTTQAIGALLALNGANYVSGSTFITVGGASCAPVTFVSASIVYCVVPPGSGLNNVVQVTVNSISSTFSPFSYGPTISSFSPIPAIVGVTVTINGDNFVSGLTSVTIDGNTCTNASITLSQISCTVPYGVGIALNLSVVTSGVAATNNSFAYVGPSISSISPTSGPTAGGFVLIVNGSNFAAPGNSVSLGGSNCSIISETTTQIQCSAPTGSGINQPIVVIAGGQMVTIVAFSYFGPSIAFVDPPDGYTIGEFSLTLLGSNFAPKGNLVTVAGSSCQVTSESTNAIQCIAPGGSGSNVVVFVNSTGQTASSTAFSYINYAVVGCYSSTDVNGISYVMPMSTYSTSYSSSLNYMCASSVAGAPSIFNFRFYSMQMEYLSTFASNVISCAGLSDYSNLVPVSSTNCPGGIGTPPYVFIYALQGLPCSPYTQTGYSVSPSTSSVAFSTQYTATCAVGYQGTVTGNVSCAGAINQGFFSGCSPLCLVPVLIGYNITQTGYVTPLSYLNATCASGYVGKVTGTMQCVAGGLTFSGVFAGCVELCPVPNITGYNISQSGLVLPLSYLNATCAPRYNGTVVGTMQCIAGTVFLGSFSGCKLVCNLYSQTGYTILPTSTSGIVANSTTYSATCAPNYIPAYSTCIFSANTGNSYPLTTSGCGTTPGTSYTIAAAVFATSGSIKTTSGSCLDVNVASCTSTTPYQGCQVGESSACGGGSNELWTYNSATNQLLSALSASACIDMTGGNMYLQPCGYSSNQVIIMSANSNQMQVGTGVTGSVQCMNGVNIGSFASCIPQLFPAYTCYYDVEGSGYSVRTLYGASPAGCSFSWSGTSSAPQNNIQIQQCITTAVSQCAGYTYVGIEYGTQVFCGNALAPGAYTLPQSSCAAGNGGSAVGPVLGGGWIMSIFALQNYACYNDTAPATILPYFATALSFSSSGALSTADISTAISQCQSACSAYYLAGIENGGACYCGNTVALTGTQPLAMNLQMCSTGGTGGADGLARSGNGLGDPQNMAIYYTALGVAASYASR